MQRLGMFSFSCASGEMLSLGNLMSSKLITVKSVKQYLLDHASKTRHHKFTRVSEDTLMKVEAATRSAVKAIVAAAPSKGQTL
jgi:hypothetical protein